MIKSNLLHPEILAALGAAGHGAHILIADSNYPYSTQGNPQAKRVFLNLAPDLLLATDVLRVLLTEINVEAAAAIVPDDGGEPSILQEFRSLLPEINIEKLTRFPFYALACAPETALIIATGERRIYACIVLTIGVVI